MGGIEVINLPQQPAPQGFADLGASLAEAGQDYARRQDLIAQQKRADAEQAKLRAEHLADVSEARSYEQADDERREKLKQANEKIEQDAKMRQTVSSALINEGYLDPKDADDMTKVSAAYQAAKRNGDIDRYKDLINRGYLSLDDIGDPDAVEQAQKGAASDSAQAFADAGEAKRNAVATAGKLESEASETLSKMHQVEADASQDPQQAGLQTPDPSAVRARAIQLARQIKGGGVPKDADIQAQMQQAEQDIRQQNYQVALQRQAQAKNLLPSLQRTYQDIQQRQSQLEKQGIFAPADMGDGGQSPGVAAPAAIQAPPAKASVLASLAGKPSTTPPAAAPVGAPGPAAVNPTTFADPNQSPVQQLAASQAAQMRQQRAQQGPNIPSGIVDPIQAAIQEIAQIDGQIKQMSVGGAGGGTDVAGIENLQAKKQSLVQKVQGLRAQQAALAGSETTPKGPTATNAFSPAVSNADGSIPTAPENAQWWADPNAP